MPPCAERICASIFACCACSALMSSSISCACARTEPSTRLLLVAHAVDRVALALRPRRAHVATALRRSVISIAIRCWRCSSVPRRLAAVGHLGLRVAHRRDDRAVLLADPLQVGAVLEQVGEAVRVEHDADDVRLVGLVELDEAVGEHALSRARGGRAAGSAGRGRARSSSCVRSSSARLASRSAWIAFSRCWSVVIVPWSASILRVRPEMSPVSTLRAAVDVVELALLLVDSVLERADARLRARAGDERQRHPQGERGEDGDQRGCCEVACAARESRLAPPRGST